jgi:hypothetical protein
MRDPEKTGAPYRPGSSPATLNDLRWVYKKLLEIEAMLAALRAEQFRLNSRVADDRKYLGAITENTNQIISLVLPTSVELRQRDEAARAEQRHKEWRRWFRRRRRETSKAQQAGRKARG